ncbi:hypothetical protein [Aureivirga marina]|uniref:hypothetical protein n=1 Tax=Aureivirga marina TaxID=1182451 RepID=UPI0018CA0195|nr:hypothetical protein [Aureivirga marina]
MKLKGGAFYYAIFLMIIVGILLSMLIVMKSAHQKVRTVSEANFQLVHANEQGINYGLYYFDDLSFQEKKLDFLGNEIELRVSKSNWGFLQILNSRSIFKNDTLTQSYFVTRKKPFQRVLYLSEQLEPLKISGNTEINGDCSLPSLGYRFHTFSNYETNNSFINGNVFQAGTELPTLNIATLKNTDFPISKTIDEYPPKLNNSFSKNTLHILATSVSILDNLDYEGKIEIESNDTLFIRNTCRFKDVIIKAPKVVIEKGFVGNMQVFATNEIIVENDVQLLYPSVLYVDTESQQKSKIVLNPNSLVIGAVITNGSVLSDATIFLEPESRIAGDVYSINKLSLQGEVSGCVTTHKFYLKTPTSVYHNIIRNGKINRNLPDGFYSILNIGGNATNHKYEKMRIL